MLQYLLLILVSVLTVGCAPGGEAQRSMSPPENDIRMPSASQVAHRVEVHRPAALSEIAAGRETADGTAAGIGCATCHEMREEEHELPDAAAGLSGPHAGMRFAHGDLACRSCHHPAQYDKLRMATGEAVPLVDAMRLCAQCHGTQKRDWNHGAHGGMQGHWDLKSGDRTRNHCVDCHDPHAPAFPTYQPVFPPRDRFLEPMGGHDG